MDDETLFHLALETPAGERPAFLDRECAGDIARRRRVEALLRSHETPDSFLAGLPTGPGAMAVLAEDLTADVGTRRPDAEVTDRRSPAEGPGSQIGPYKLLQQIGEGGMGTVYMAEQEKPVRRKVALKVIKAGMDSRQVIARFEAERQALALMDHPNIAKVLDAGATTAGRPYFVMELVKGVPITEYCDREHLTPAERLRLFVPVCQAVQHAHQKGVIHRDLKPSNVLIALYDGDPVPKVIDFGIAKATGGRLTDRTVFTEVGSILGTLEYMAPEQAELNNLDIDTRADVYALGVLLYELLTGSTPFTRKQLVGVAFTEMLRLIREVEPARPSTRLSASAQLSSIADSRKLAPKRLTRLVHGDLDWVVMKCLEKERHRRYETANGLALDLQRYLADEPVQAGPPGAGYRARKFVRRNRGPVLAAAALVVTLTVGLAGTAAGLVRASAAEASARQEAALARRAERLATDRLDEATRQRERADAEAASAQAVNDFLQRDLLAQASPIQQPDRDLTLRAALDRAALAIEGRFDRQPLVEAAIRQTIGETYRGLGLFAAALPHAERALGLRRHAPGASETTTLTSMAALALLLRNEGRLAEAEVLYREAIDLGRRGPGERRPETLEAMGGLAFLLHQQGKSVEAELLARRVLGLRRSVLGEENFWTIESLNSLSKIVEGLGKPAEAEELGRKALELSRRVLGNEHPMTLLTLLDRATLLIGRGEQAEAEALCREGLATARRVGGPGHPRTLTAVELMATLLRDRGDFAAAEPLLVQGLEVSRRIHGEVNQLTVILTLALVDLYLDWGQPDRAASLAERAVAECRRAGGMERLQTRQSLVSLGKCRLGQGRFVEAEELLREPLAGMEKAGLDLWPRYYIRSLIGESLTGQGKHAEAEPFLLAGYEGMKARKAGIPALQQRYLVKASERLVRFYDARSRPDEAARWRQELATVRPPRGRGMP